MLDSTLILPFRPTHMYTFPPSMLFRSLVVSEPQSSLLLPWSHLWWFSNSWWPSLRSSWEKHLKRWGSSESRTSRKASKPSEKKSRIEWTIILTIQRFWRSAEKSWTTLIKIRGCSSRQMSFYSNPKRKLSWLRMMKANKISVTHLIRKRKPYSTDGKQSGPNISHRAIAMPRSQCSTIWESSSWRTNMSNKKE